MATVGAIIAQLATLVWFLNLVMTLVRGRLVRLEGMSLGQIAGTVAASLEWSWDLTSFTPSLRFIKIHGNKRGLTSMIIMAIVGAILIIVSVFPLVLSGNTYTLQTWTWITILTIGIILASIGSLKGMKSI